MLPISTSACQAVRPAQGRGGALLEAETGRQLHDAVLLQHGQLGQHGRSIAPAHSRGHCRLVNGAADPFSAMKQPATPIARLDPA